MQKERTNTLSTTDIPSFLQGCHWKAADFVQNRLGSVNRIFSHGYQREADFETLKNGTATVSFCVCVYASPYK